MSTRARQGIDDLTYYTDNNIVIRFSSSLAIASNKVSLGDRFLDEGKLGESTRLMAKC